MTHARTKRLQDGASRLAASRLVRVVADTARVGLAGDITATRESVEAILEREEAEFRAVQRRRLEARLDADHGPSYLAIFGRGQP